MPRMARLVVPRYPHHVTQRGSRRQRTFFDESDYSNYLELIRANKLNAGVDIWAYCLMPNHVHMVAVPDHPNGLAKLFRVAHHRHAVRVNAEHGWQGHLWQERFHSFVMDEAHLMATVRYVELNPVRGELCDRPEEWRWSSARAHLYGAGDRIVNVRPMLQRVTDWKAYLATRDRPETIETLRAHSSSGRPAGSREFIATLERLTGRRLLKRAGLPRLGKAWSAG